jgi:dihydrodipicolinate synthase/N-acetylneuraminate lyase
MSMTRALVTKFSFKKKINEQALVWLSKNIVDEIVKGIWVTRKQVQVRHVCFSR